MAPADGRQRLSPGEAPLVAIWISLAGVALAVRLVRINHFSFWLDEILETYTTRMSWPMFWRSLRWEAFNAPLDYSLRKVLECVQPTDALRRIPSVIWGTLTVAAFGGFLARRGGRVLGWVAAGLLALAPYHVRYSQEVRTYALGLLLLVASLLALEAFLERPRMTTLAGLYAACLATLYTLYLAAFLLVFVALSLLIEDSWDDDPRRRAAARRFLAWSPAFVATLAAGYAPWWPVLFRALGSAPMTSAPPWSMSRLWRYVTYFGFAYRDGSVLHKADLVFLAVLVTGVAAAVRTPRLRCLIVWGIGGVALFELAERRHPTYDSIFHWLPAGLGLTALAALGLSQVLRWRIGSVGRWAVCALVVALSVRGLVGYFHDGRPDWRPLARYLAATPSSERIFVENPYTQLCLGYYLVGPDWLCCKKPTQREIANLDGDLSRLLTAWNRRTDAWLVLAAGPESPPLRSWSASFFSMSFSTAEGAGGAIVRRLPAGLPD
jgi:hypothetical protein